MNLFFESASNSLRPQPRGCSSNMLLEAYRVQPAEVSAARVAVAAVVAALVAATAALVAAIEETVF